MSLTRGELEVRDRLYVFFFFDLGRHLLQPLPIPFVEDSSTNQVMDRDSDGRDIDHPLLTTMEELVLRETMMSEQKVDHHQKELCDIFCRLKRRMVETEESEKVGDQCHSQICAWRGRR